MNRDEALHRLGQILEGIDRDEGESVFGWWETSDGAAFGAERLAELRELVEDLT